MANEKWRLIDAKALWEYVKTTPISAATRTTIMCLLDIAPTVDAVEVVHGRWEQIGYDKAMDRITCSCCLEYWNIADNDTESFNYCPNCGAKMDGEKDGCS